MNEQRWQRISALFDALVELDAGARAEALAKLPEEDRDLRGDVERLLDGDAEIEDGARDPLAAPFAAASIEGLVPDMEGTLIGPWRVLRELGRGGMGVVHLAERADGQYEQLAAIKLMRASGDAAGLRRRFLRERQILARLEHPHIARLLDGGVSAAGDPYFALEYIDGEPLTGFVSRHPADVGVRLRLFLDVCAAVQFAHRQLIVHCDIKPSNVLVNRDGVVKLLDFGIASVLAGDVASAETQLRALTPAYASPEQLRGEPITTASDIYALGAVLYELLTGVRAYRIGAEASSFERLAAISDARRALPSAAADLPDPQAPGRVAGLASLPARILRGDLDVITATALHADPEQRYASVEALADDVRRYLEGAPIAARPPSARYRIGKFVARHRLGVALAALALIALFAALGTALVQAGRAREQAAEARRAEALALEQGERAEAVRRILVGVFEQAAPDAHDGQPITAQQLLEKGERQIEGAIDVQPAVEAEAATLIAELYVQIGTFDRAEVLLQRALKATDDARVPDDVKARVLVGIAAIEDEKSAHADAIEHARRGLDLLGGGGRGVAPTVAKAHYVIAHSLISLGRTAEAEAMLRESLVRDRVALGENSDAVADSLVQLGNVFAESSRFDESEQAFRQAIAAFTATYGADSYHVAHVLNELSNMLNDRGDLDGAEVALRQSLDIRLRTVGPDHRDTLIVRHNLLVLLEAEGRIAEALPQRLEVIARVGASGKLHARDLASYYLAIGRDQRDLGDFDAAETHLRKAIDLFSGSLGANSDSAISAWRGLGNTQLFSGRFDAAEASLRRALELQHSREPVSALRVAAVSADLGNTLRVRGRLDAALELLEPAAAFFAEPAQVAHAARPGVLVALAEAQLAKGDAEGALGTAELALAGARASFTPGHVQLASPLLAVARATLARGDAAAARPLFDEALRVRSALQSPADVRVLEVEVERLRVFDALGQRNEAADLRARILPLISALPAAHAQVLKARADGARNAEAHRRRQ